MFEIRGTSFSRSVKHTANAVSIRFPRIIKIRDDKDPENATNLKEFDLIVSKSIIVEYVKWLSICHATAFSLFMI